MSKFLVLVILLGSVASLSNSALGCVINKKTGECYSRPSVGFGRILGFAGEHDTPDQQQEVLDFQCHGQNHGNDIVIDGRLFEPHHFLKLRIRYESEAGKSFVKVIGGLITLNDEQPIAIVFDRVGSDHDVSGEFILDPFERSKLLTSGIPLIGLQCKIVEDASIPICKGMHFPCKKDGQWKCCYQGGH